MYDSVIAARFWAKVDRSGECWEWTGAKGEKGYGKVGIRGKVLRAPRVAVELARGPIAEGLTVDHLCFNAGCVRPDHLELVTFAENVRRKVERYRATHTECQSGHPYTDQTTYYTGNQRRCRLCTRARNLADKRWTRHGIPKPAGHRPGWRKAA